MALLPKYLIERPHAENRHLCMLKIDSPNSKIQIGLYWRKRKHFSNSAKMLRDYIIKYFR
ncbi:hypothetical protein GH807_14410 [Acetobacterium tundrae]|uniref:LysR substrate-binding domain-containing protein n=1 Tax=Acetobacterium tundrae TaxID=132932 RepID=A0ABR6WP43_9FIRM|nr:hypothetical protein [Acetobacterium tundrae]